MSEKQQYRAGSTDGTGTSGVNSGVDDIETIFPDGELPGDAELTDIYSLLRFCGERARESVESPDYTNEELHAHFEESTGRAEMKKPEVQKSLFRVSAEAIVTLLELLDTHEGDEIGKTPLERFPMVDWEGVSSFFSDDLVYWTGSFTHRIQLKEVMEADVVPVISMHVAEREDRTGGFLAPSMDGVRWIKNPRFWADEVRDPTMGSGGFLRAAVAQTELARAASHRYVLVHFTAAEAPKPLEFTHTSFYEWSVQLWSQTGEHARNRLAAAKVAELGKAHPAPIEAEPAAVLWVSDPSRPPGEPEAVTLVPLPESLTPVDHASDRLWDWSVKVGQLFFGEISEPSKSR